MARRKQVDHAGDRIARRDHQVGTDAGGDLVARGVEMAGDRARRGEAGELQAFALHHVEGQHGVDRAFDRGAADLAVALRGMGVAHREQRALDLDRQVERGARRQIADVEVAADPARRHDRLRARRGGGDADGAAEGLQRHLAVAAPERLTGRRCVIFPDVQRRFGELVGQQAEARDVCRPAPGGALFLARGEAVDRHLQHVAGHRPVNIDGAGDRVDLAEIERLHILDRRGRAKLARRGVKTVEEDGRARRHRLDRGKRVVPAEMVLRAVDRVAAGFAHMRLLRHIDIIIVHRDRDRIDVEVIAAAHARRLHRVAVLVEHRHPGGVLHDLHVDVRPQRQPFVLLCRIDDGIGLGRFGIEILVAVPRPVPAALDRAGTAEDRAVEVRRIGEVGDPGHAARPDHRCGLRRAARFDHVRLGQRLDLGLDPDRRQILLDRLRDARVRVGVHHVKLGLEAVGIARLGQHRLGLRRIEGIARVILGVARHRGRQRLRRGGGAAVDHLHDPVLVDRHVDRAADLDGVEGLHLDVQRDVAGLQLAADDDLLLLVGVVHHLGEFRRRDAVAGDVDLALLQAQQRHDRLLADFEGHAVEIGQAGAPVVGVLRQQQLLPDRPVAQLEGAGADRVLAEIGAPFLDFLLRHDRGEVQRHHVQEGGVGARQLDLHGGGVEDGHARQAGGRAVGHRVIAGDRAEEARAGRLRCGRGDAVERIFHVLGGHLAAVVELHALAQVEGIGLAVGRDLVAFGKPRAQLGGARHVIHQPVEDRLDHRPVLPVVADRRVERGDVVLVGDDDVAAGFGVLIGGVVLRRGEAGEGQRHRKSARRQQRVHQAHLRLRLLDRWWS
ncbi:hypothetical protein SDC9_26374 [bioreactor metagenome]|uniref:NAD-specific glutamate dehydrogenase n=1 Tax=bioreactor metagenome TaxID=1076179 RepID=A0A644UNG4_9ZZZZ